MLMAPPVQQTTSGLGSLSIGMFRSGSKKDEPCSKASLQDKAVCDSACIHTNMIHLSYMFIILVSE